MKYLIILFFCTLAPYQSWGQRTYPFGFQGMERDDEIQGMGNAYHTFYRQLNARRGTWSSMDPARSPGNNPYQAFANNPISFVDFLGDTAISYRDYVQTLVEVGETVRASDEYVALQRLVAYQDEALPPYINVTRRSTLPSEEQVTERDLESLYLILGVRELENRIGPLTEVQLRGEDPETIDRHRIGPANPNATTVDPFIQIREELDVVTSSPFASYVFVNRVNNGATREEALNHARMEGLFWNFAGRVRAGSKRTGSQAARHRGGHDQSRLTPTFRHVQPIRGSDLTVPPMPNPSLQTHINRVRRR